ncbi:MAG: pantoate--beta-alanine ligase [Bacteroidetes bacterium]|nr:pantoate--beta-alanine ligase [Bacteroidota bacterium]
MREKSGLAMSSRNLRLSEEERKIATQIYKSNGVCS